MPLTKRHLNTLSKPSLIDLILKIQDGKLITPYHNDDMITQTLLAAQKGQLWERITSFILPLWKNFSEMETRVHELIDIARRCHKLNISRHDTALMITGKDDPIVLVWKDIYASIIDKPSVHEKVKEIGTDKLIDDIVIGVQKATKEFDGGTYLRSLQPHNMMLNADRAFTEYLKEVTNNWENKPSKRGRNPVPADHTILVGRAHAELKGKFDSKHTYMDTAKYLYQIFSLRSPHELTDIEQHILDYLIRWWGDCYPDLPKEPNLGTIKKWVKQAYKSLNAIYQAN